MKLCDNIFMNRKIIKVEPQGYCGGVRQAIAKVKACRNQYPDQPITILGNLVHNEYVKEALGRLDIRTLEQKGRTRLELLDQINEGVVVFTAHGISDEVRQKAIAKGLTIVDASCPFVLQTQKIVKQKLQAGYTVFYIGKYRHPEAEAIYLHQDHVALITKPDDIPTAVRSPIFVTNQTTMSVLDIRDLFLAIRRYYPQAEFHDEICNATRVRQQAILDLKKQNVQALIVVGSPTSNNTAKLAEIGRLAGIRSIQRIQDVTELDPAAIAEAETIAVTSGASTPPYLTQMVIDTLHHPEQKQKIHIEEIL
jgi:4-hydroxy-3-methylbut-2-enyl diphosphate reductase